MKISAERRARPAKKSEPSWDVALLFPLQGQWSEADFLWLDANGPRRMMELVDGFLEVLPMPDVGHQRILKFLSTHLDAYVNARGLGEVLFAPLPVRLGNKHLREPDVMFFKANRVKNPHDPPDGADLVMEIVSPGKRNRDRDLKEKRRVYAKAKIPEYWIVDPQDETITVLTLRAKGYQLHGKFKKGTPASSKLLPGFTLDPAAVFAAGAGSDL